jgi:hypothetical protein
LHFQGGALLVDTEISVFGTWSTKLGDQRLLWLSTSVFLD